MEDDINFLFQELSSKDDKVRLNALNSLLKITESKVAWFNTKYEILIEKLKSDNSYQRSIGIMLLSNLAKNDSKNILKKFLQDILKHTQDEKFITSRQCIQNIWKFGIYHKENKDKIIDHLKNLFSICEDCKHYNLIRLDIIQSLFRISNEFNDQNINKQIYELISKEKNEKYKKEYQKILGKK